jgi:hypothetical protein
MRKRKTKVRKVDQMRKLNRKRKMKKKKRNLLHLPSLPPHRVLPHHRKQLRRNLLRNKHPRRRRRRFPSLQHRHRHHL